MKEVLSSVLWLVLTHWVRYDGDIDGLACLS